MWVFKSFHMITILVCSDWTCMIRSVLLAYCPTAEQEWSQSGLMLKGCHKLSFDSPVALILMPN